FYHLLHRMWFANISFVERPGPTDIHHLRQCVLSRRLVSMVMDPHGPAGRCEGQADGPTNPSGGTGHKHGLWRFTSGSRHVSLTYPNRSNGKALLTLQDIV